MSTLGNSVGPKQWDTYDKAEVNDAIAAVDAKADGANTALVNVYTKTETDTQISTAVGSIDLSSKQDVLVSGTNIKTLNGKSVLGAGDLSTIQTTVTGSAGSVANSQIIKFDSGSTEGTSKYTFDGSAPKAIDIKAGANVTLTKSAGSITINSTASGTIPSNGDIGSYALLFTTATGSSIVAGTTYAGSGLQYIGYNINYSSGTITINSSPTSDFVSGTWKAMGTVPYFANYRSATLFLRIA